MTYKVQGTEAISANLEISAAGFASSNADSYIEILDPTETAYTFQGAVSGYSSGGAPGPGLAGNEIDKFPFTSDTNATDVGDLTDGVYGPSGQSSSTHGYTSGGYSKTPPANTRTTISKFPFASDTNATNVGNLTQARYTLTGQSSSTDGYASGSYNTPGTCPIEKFSFASDSNATSIGNLSQFRNDPSGQSSTTYGYTSGGSTFPPPTAYSNVVDKFPFASHASALDVGDLTTTRRGGAGQSSTTSGYTSGGFGGSYSNVIDKFPFASNANASDVGDLSVTRGYNAGQSSTDSGYTSGGRASPTALDVIDKFPFASDTNASDVGNLSVARSRVAGQQY